MSTNAILDEVYAARERIWAACGGTLEGLCAHDLNWGGITMDNDQFDFETLPAWECTEFLMKYPEQADRCNWARMSRIFLT